MSVHQESLDTMARGMESAPAVEEMPNEATDAEYTELRADSLAMFGAAIGGAILGMLLTILVLALINGGTLVFGSSQEQLAAMETALQRVNENVGAVSTNVDIVAGQAAANQEELAAVETAVQAELTTQAGAIDANIESIGVLDQTRAQFDIFVTALADALNSMEVAVSDAAGRATEFAEETVAIGSEPAATGVESLPAPMVANSADVPAQNVVVVIFADANGNGLMDADEASVAGAAVTLQDAAGEVVAETTTDETGAQFEALDAGDYLLIVGDAAGYELLSQSAAPVSVAGDDAEGHVVYIPAAAAAE